MWQKRLLQFRTFQFYCSIWKTVLKIFHNWNPNETCPPGYPHQPPLVVSFPDGHTSSSPHTQLPLVCSTYRRQSSCFFDCPWFDHIRQQLQAEIHSDTQQNAAWTWEFLATWTLQYLMRFFRAVQRTAVPSSSESEHSEEEV